MKIIQVKKGEMLQRRGDTQTKAYVVKKGLLRSYTTDEKGREHTFMFAPEGWIIADAQAVDSPAQLFIEALEDSTLGVESKEIARQQINTEALLRRIFVLQQRVIMLMSAPAIERYEHFVETYPEITQRVPQKMIASFLGITPEALSKVKGERLKKR